MATNNVAPKVAASSNKKLIIAVVVLILVIIATATAVILALNSRGNTDTPTIGYAADAKVFLDEDSLQAAMDEAMQNSANNSVALRYQNNAYSDDGINFECYIANSTGNIYDMFLAIYADAEMTDQLFLSGLIRPGSGFEQLKLEHALEPGTNTVYVAATLVDTEDDGTQSIVSQVVHTMDFYVTE